MPGFSALLEAAAQMIIVRWRSSREHRRCVALFLRFFQAKSLLYDLGMALQQRTFFRLRRDPRLSGRVGLVVKGRP